MRQVAWALSCLASAGEIRVCQSEVTGPDLHRERENPLARVRAQLHLVARAPTRAQERFWWQGACQGATEAAESRYGLPTRPNGVRNMSETRPDPDS
jgi:hypothetical protein